MMSKRRQFARVSIALPFSLHVGDERYSGKTFNVSMSGVYLSVKEGNVTAIGSGLIGKCQVSLGEVDITLSCQVLRVYNKELALQFTELSEDQFNLLRALISCGSKAKEVILEHKRTDVCANQNLEILQANLQAKAVMEQHSR